MKQVNFKYLFSISLLSIFSFMAPVHSATWRFCNVDGASTTPFLVGVNYFGTSKPLSKLAPGNSLDFSASLAKGFCLAPLPANYNLSNSILCNTPGTSYYPDPEPAPVDMTVSVQQTSPTTFSYTVAPGVVACSTSGS